jgi:hypothetical protein
VNTPRGRMSIDEYAIEACGGDGVRALALIVGLIRRGILLADGKLGLRAARC